MTKIRSVPRPRPGILIALLLTAAAGLPSGARGQEGAEDSPFADADMPPPRQARCSEVAGLIAGRETEQKRVDFSVTGALALVHSDGALAYLGLCGAPDPKVLCVTYQTNGLQVGDEVVVTGGFAKPEPDFVLLDPCMASRPEEPGE